ncbi:MAG TPA: amidohydrolase family protein [Candidatus Binataceae bacterium]|nr:amidohydrolase family protein [Candidatus Binataceae bacterium]
MGAMMRVIDGDGHVYEDGAAIAGCMPEPYNRYARLTGVFPPLDHFHTAFIDNGFIEEMMMRASVRRIGPDEWITFLEDTGIEFAVLYPTAGLACGKITDAYFANAAVRGYNDWLHDAYLRKSKRLKGMGLLPMCDIDGAVKEYRRVVKDLGMCGVMLPSNGLKAHPGSADFWPIYAEAEKLGGCVAFHGGCHDHMGIDDLNVFAAYHALGHPLGMMRALVSMVYNGIFDRFPGLKVAYLEAGVAWFLTALERGEGSFKVHTPFDPEHRLINVPKNGDFRAYVRKLIHDGRIFVGVEGDEPDLAHAVKTLGSEPFLFSSDFPHEVDAEICRHEIGEVMESHELTETDKQGILADNSRRFYNLN